MNASVWYVIGEVSESEDAARQKIEMSKSTLRAQVKGSIYGVGENMSVFGVCLDAFDQPVVNSTALFSAWWPNGYVYFQNSSMTKISEGYFVWNGLMPATPGTYLTEMECSFEGQIARAFGEWQNPQWVASISEALLGINETKYFLYDLNGTIVGLNASMEELKNLTVALLAGQNATLEEIQNLSYNVNVGFNTTLENLISINNSLTQNIMSVNSTLISINSSLTQNFNYTNALVLNQTNSSSYLASLIMQLFNFTINSTLPPSGLVNVTVEYSPNPSFMSLAECKATAYSPATGKKLFDPDVYCLANTTYSGGYVYMEPQGMAFYYSELNAGYATYVCNVQCYYI